MNTLNTFGAIRGGMYHVAAREAAEAKGSVRAVRTDQAEFEARLDRTLLAFEAMWTLLRDKLGVTDLELVERINELDISDGKLDGKVRKPPVSCPSCGRTMSRKFPKCMYCGQPVVHDPFA
ncbi:MAG: hypothetical protein WBE26_17145 [Phycisphaerae bacterium]